MVLCSYFIPLLAYVKALSRQSEPDPADVDAQLQLLIGQARDEALKDSVSLERFHEALFPVVAWTDERLALLPSWREDAAWRPYMLQRKLFHTTLAGVQFFEQMDKIDETDHELREVFLTCLGLGFVGKYSQTPNSPTLLKFKQSQYELVRGRESTPITAEESPLFSPAYRTASGGSKTGHRLGPRSKLALIIFIPLAILMGIAAWFDYQLVQTVSEITARLP
ncbi:MAG TPA: DotU family type IV/VI secretion system protein [Orrella sp.]